MITLPFQKGGWIGEKEEEREERKKEREEGRG